LTEKCLNPTFTTKHDNRRLMDETPNQSLTFLLYGTHTSVFLHSLLFLNSNHIKFIFCFRFLSLRLVTSTSRVMPDFQPYTYARKAQGFYARFTQATQTTQGSKHVACVA